MKASEWIDRVKVAKGLESDYRVAQELRLTRSAVSKYRSRESTLDENTALTVAQALGIDAAIVLTDQAMERAKDDDARGAWATVLQRLGGMAAAVVFGFGVGFTPPPAQASGADYFMTSTHSVYYVNKDHASIPLIQWQLRKP